MSADNASASRIFRRPWFLVTLAIGAIAMTAAARLAPAQPGATPTFTADQVDRGRAVYGRNCTDCHGTTLDNGTVFRVVSFGPGVTPRNHRTDSIDYAVVMSGEIDMELDGESVHLKAGDVLVQRGTIHNWVNQGSAPCVIAFVLVAAKPVTAGGKVLNAVG